MAVEEAHGIRYIYRASRASGQGPHQRPRRQHVDVSRDERSADERPVGVDEAESTGDWDVAEHLSYPGSLGFNAEDELVPVSSGDHQALGPWSEQPAFHLELWTALVTLGVDDPDSGRGDG